MSDKFSLTPGFSLVFGGGSQENRFNGFPPVGKPLKRLAAGAIPDTRLKPGVNENQAGAVSFCRKSFMAA